MRKIVFFLVFFASYVQAFTQMPNTSVYLESNYGIDIPFQISSYDVVDTVLPVCYGVSQTFNTIIMGDEGYGVVDSIGFPLLPRYFFDLHVPVNSSQYSVSIILPNIDSFYVSYPLLPALEDILKDSAVYIFNMDTLYYGSNHCFVNIGTAVSDEYKVFGEKGITVSVIPFEYRPADGMVRVLTAGKIRVSYTLNPSLMPRDTMTHRRTKVVEEHLSNLFCNYETRQIEEINANYLIITPPQFESIVAYFADYKQNMGYNVTVVNTNTTGTTASSIISYLKSKYNNISTRPEYVLLVGAPSFIPVSDGTSNTLNDPATDLYYSLLDGNDYMADVFLGRMPVSNVQEVQSVINKTIFMETSLRGMDKKATFIAGYESRRFMQDYFEKAHDYVIPYTFQPKGFLCAKLYQPDIYQIQTNLSNDPLYFVYSGHGSIYNWEGNSFFMTKADIDTAHNTIYPFSFAFACHTGNFTNEHCSANKWILPDSKGSVSYLGSSVGTYCHSDFILEKSIFGSEFSENKSISAIINAGKKQYRDYFWATIHIVRTIRYLKAYNLLGDPSLIVGGKGCLNSICFHNNQHYYSGEFTEYHVASTISHDYNFIIDIGASIHLAAGEEIVLTDGFHAANGSDFVAKIEACEPDDGDGMPNLEDGIGERALLGGRTQDGRTRCVPTDNGLTIYPNPTGGTLTVESTSPIREITVYDLSGRVMMTANGGDAISVMDVSSLRNGIYLLRVMTDSGVQTARFVKN